MENLHAGLPTWWKQQINVGNLLGLAKENPMWINLEALVNPLHGLTGVDFTDPKRRIDNWGAVVEDFNKMGPSVWAPYQIGLALHYKIQGQDEASARWGGRILPFSKPLRDITALADPKGLGIEIDPSVLLFGGGIEAYERGRIGRALGSMITEGKYPQADIIEAAYNQTGAIWDIARAKTIHDRAPNLPLAAIPFLFGAGFKPRSVTDVQIDQMWGQINGLMTNRANMSVEDYGARWDELRQNFPFMETVLLAKKSGLNRDEALAWSVLGRIPHGGTNAVAELVGINRADLDRFYDVSGDLNEMSNAERLRFMGSIIEIGALLDIPEQGTKIEWDAASNLYKEMRIQGETTFGEGIWDLVNLYFAIRDPEDPEPGRAFIRQHPIVSEALDWQNVIIQNTPIMASYYTSQEKVRSFYFRQRTQAAENLFGEDLWDHFEVYNLLRDAGEFEAARQYWKDHPQLELYGDFKDETELIVESKINSVSNSIPKAKPPLYRDAALNSPDTPSAPSALPFDPNERNNLINSLVVAYSNAFTDDTGNKEEVRDAIRGQADKLWPGTRSQADKYYGFIEEDPQKAVDYLLERNLLQQRIAWEYGKVQLLDLMSKGEIFRAAGIEGFEDVQPSRDETLNQPNLEPDTPLGRLIRDAGGIPDHLAESYLSPEQLSDIRVQNRQETLDKFAKKIDQFLKGRFTEREQSIINEDAAKLGYKFIIDEDTLQWELRPLN